MRLVRRLTIAVVAAVAAVAAACSSGPTVAAFTEACGDSTNLSEEICSCVAKKAKDELSADGFAFLAATLRGNDEETAALRAKLEVTEAIAAGTFMVSGPAACAKNLATD